MPANGKVSRNIPVKLPVGLIACLATQIDNEGFKTTEIIT